MATSVEPATSEDWHVQPGESDRSYFDRVCPYVHNLCYPHRVGVANGLDGVGEPNGVGIIIPRSVDLNTYEDIKRTLRATISVSYFEPEKREMD